MSCNAMNVKFSLKHNNMFNNDMNYTKKMLKKHFVVQMEPMYVVCKVQSTYYCSRVNA